MVKFSLDGDVLKMITDYKINTTAPTDAKLILSLLGGMRSDTHTREKSVRERNSLKTFLFRDLYLNLGQVVRNSKKLQLTQRARLKEPFSFQNFQMKYGKKYV